MIIKIINHPDMILKYCKRRGLMLEGTQTTRTLDVIASVQNAMTIDDDDSDDRRQQRRRSTARTGSGSVKSERKQRRDCNDLDEELINMNIYDSAPSSAKSRHVKTEMVFDITDDDDDDDDTDDLLSSNLLDSSQSKSVVKAEEKQKLDNKSSVKQERTTASSSSSSSSKKKNVSAANGAPVQLNEVVEEIITRSEERV